MQLTPEQRDATECALAAANAVGLYTGWGIEEFRARPCQDLVDISGLTCPFGEDYNDQVLITFFQVMEVALAQRPVESDQKYVAYEIRVSDMCRFFAGSQPTWGVWCDHVASTLGVPL